MKKITLLASLNLLCAFLFLVGAAGAFAQRGGEIIWSVDLAYTPATAAPRVAPSGAIYIHSDDLYAISPSGEILWRKNSTDPKAVDVGLDGTVYSGSGGTIFAEEVQRVGDDGQRAVAFRARSFDAHVAHVPPSSPQDDRALQLACQCRQTPRNGADAPTREHGPDIDNRLDEVARRQCRIAILADGQLDLQPTVGDVDIGDDLGTIRSFGQLPGGRGLDNGHPRAGGRTAAERLFVERRLLRYERLAAGFCARHGPRRGGRFRGAIDLPDGARRRAVARPIRIL